MASSLQAPLELEVTFDPRGQQGHAELSGVMCFSSPTAFNNLHIPPSQFTTDWSFLLTAYWRILSCLYKKDTEVLEHVLGRANKLVRE